MSLVDIMQSAQQVLHLQEEIKLHIEFCKDYGLSSEDIENQEEDQGKYSAYFIQDKSDGQNSMHRIYKVGF
jgi:ATP-dependent RNA helicase DDX5/DBP2